MIRPEQITMHKVTSVFQHLIQLPMRLPSYILFVTLGAIVTLISLLSSPSDPKNALFLGYSPIRLVLIVGMLFLIISLLILTWKLARRPEQSQRLWEKITQQKPISDLVLWFSTLSFIVTLIILLMPSYRLAGNLSEYAARLYPVLVWLAIVSGAAMLVLVLLRRQLPLGIFLRENGTAIRAGVFVLLLFMIMWVIVAATGIGIRDREDYWYGAGVPVLGLQVLVSLVAGGFFYWLEVKHGGIFKKDILIFGAIWLISAWLWVQEPYGSNHFMPDTAKNVMYPYSDSATFDIASQYALIGQGLFNGDYFDRALYSAFLTYLHAFVGQDYVTLLALQAAVYAIFPSIVYLLGRELHSRALGISAGLLIALRGVNSIITAKWIDTASPKMMLTDFPTAIGIAVFLFLILKWVKNPAKLPLAVWAGGVLGLTIMLRTHVLLLLPVVVVFFLIFVKPRLNRAALGSLLLILGMLTSTLPWDIRNRSNDTPLFFMYYSRIEVIFRVRYGVDLNAPVPQPVPSLPVSENSRARIAVRDFVQYGFSNDLQEEVCDSRSCSIVNHFFHNFVTSVLFLPNSFVFDDLWNTVKLGAPYWNQDWTGGDIGGTRAFFIGLNCLLISLGVGAFWERNKPATLLFGTIFLVYLATNSLGFTSGGRYITPVDWMVVILFMMGGLQAVIWVLRLVGSGSLFSETILDGNNSAIPHRTKPYTLLFGTLILIFMLGSLLPFSETLFERRYLAREPADALVSLEEQGWLEQAGLEKDELTRFLESPDAKLIEGRLLYPRYYPAGTGQPDLSTHFMIRDYPRLAFILIGPSERDGRNVVAPGVMPDIPLHGADVVVIGCTNTEHYASFTDALLIIVLTEPGRVYQRVPDVPLQCPFEEP
jgi:hypothetical protein